MTKRQVTAQRRADLLAAQQAAAAGQHDRARALFALHGIDYFADVAN